MEFRLATICALVLIYSGSAFGNIHETLRYFETLKLSDIKHRTRRSIDPNHEAHLTEVKVATLGRDFHLYLKPSKILSPGFKASIVSGSGKLDSIKLSVGTSYSGQVKGDKSAVADVSYDDTGSMLANIVTKEDIYIIEPSWRFLPHSDNHTMVAYRKSDVRFENADNGQHTKSTCGIREGLELDEELHGRISIGSDSEQKSDNDRKSRAKRQSASQYLGPKTTCQLMVVADYRFFQYMGGSSASQTASYMIHVIQYVNTLYRKTQFDVQGGAMTNVGFEIGELRIHNESTPSSSTLQGRTHYNVKTDFWDTKELLEAFSADKYWKNFCLAHLFTYRKFSNGVLGLAYIASERKNAVGGLCSPFYSKYPGVELSLNTGWSSSQNAGGHRILALQAQLVTAHELGHNMGSEHDPETDQCAPSDYDDGKFIMYPWAVSGYDKNNLLFSPCSREYIFQVLKVKGYHCFKEGRGDGAFCGNGRIDKGETCDGGWNTKNDLDPCCANDCQLRPGKKCSPMNYGCCSEECEPASRSQVCRPALEGSCLAEIKCDGVSMTCPNIISFKNNSTPCIDQGICKNGECLNFCEMFDINLTPCICAKDTGQACHRCCKEKSGRSVCQSINNTLLPDGRPCYQGVCSQGVCEKKSTDMVERLFDIIEKLTIDSFVQFMKSNIVGTVIILSLLIWIPASCTVSFIDRKKSRKEKENRDWLNRSNMTLLREEEKMRVRRVGTPQLRRPIAGSVVRQSEPSAPPPAYSEAIAPGKPYLGGGDSNQLSGEVIELPRRRPVLMRSPEIHVPLASSEDSRISRSSQGFDIGPDIYRDQDHETNV